MFVILLILQEKHCVLIPGTKHDGVHSYDARIRPATVDSVTNITGIIQSSFEKIKNLNKFRSQCLYHRKRQHLFENHQRYQRLQNGDTQAPNIPCF